MNHHRKLPRVLFLCTGNACRSQMAEGWLRYFQSGNYEALSAGIEAHGLNPMAVAVMAEVGVDISQQQSNTIKELSPFGADYVISVCSYARRLCPPLPPVIKTLHATFDSPPLLAVDPSSTDGALMHYRRVRDEIRDFVRNIDAALAA